MTGSMPRSVSHSPIQPAGDAWSPANVSGCPGSAPQVFPGADRNRDLQGGPSLVDFGATSTVYTTRKQGQAPTFRSRSGGVFQNIIPYDWRVSHSTGGRETVLAESRPLKERRGQELQFTEGWVHVMDRPRCTAIAIDHFHHLGEMNVTADGRVQF